LDRDGIALQLGAAAIKGALDDEAQKGGKLRRPAEHVRTQDAIQSSKNRGPALCVLPFRVLAWGHRGLVQFLTPFTGYAITNGTSLSPSTADPPPRGAGMPRRAGDLQTQTCC